MYGAVLRPQTELVDSGEAHIGVLFLTNEGYSTMCGHATLAVSRLLVDHAGAGAALLDSLLLSKLKYDPENQQVIVNLHAPCGLVQATVPAVETEPGHWRTDMTRPTSYLSVPSYTTGIWVTVHIPEHLRWPELGDRDCVVVDIAYGGAFYVFVGACSLGFKSSLSDPDVHALGVAASRLKEAFNSTEQLRKFYLQHPEHEDLQFLYSIFITNYDLGKPAEETLGAETGLCFFANGQIDRSPTGSGVQARIALAYAKGRIKLNERWTYHSLVSNAYDGEGAFIGEAVEEVDVGGRKGVIVRVSGKAHYTGCSSFAVEKDDAIGKGFWFV